MKVVLPMEGASYALIRVSYQAGRTMGELTGTLCDLGPVSGPVLLFGGPYSNLSATRAMMDEADRMDIPQANRICTGDVVAYCAEPEDTVALMRTRSGPVVAGNCEVQLAAKADDCGCGFDEGSACDLLSAGWYPFANRAISPGTRAWMADLPTCLVFSHAGRRCCVVHGGGTEISRFLWPVTSDDDLQAEARAIMAIAGPVDLIISGHSGVSFDRQIGSLRWVNAGVIGMPPNDGARATRFAVLGADGAVSLRSLDYDPGETVRAMRAAGLTQGYERALESGWWPSEDVLPEALRRQTAPA